MVKRIRMLQRAITAYKVVPQGTVLRVPEDIGEATAQSWLKGGIAEEDKMAEGPPETKDAKKKVK